MTSKQRMLAAIRREKPDRLPVTSHHIMPYFLDTYMNGVDYFTFFDHFGLDPIVWTVPHRPDTQRRAYFSPGQENHPFLGSQQIFSDTWKITSTPVPDPQYKTERFEVITPKGTMTTLLQSNVQTTWVTEHLVKDKRDIDLIAEFVPYPLSDVDSVNATAEEFGERGLVRGHIICFDIYGQPGCWQDACCLYGTEKMIMEVYDDPVWVREFLTILQQRKIHFIRSLKGARYDILELGGGDASTTVISPKLFNEFVAPFDSVLIEEAHNVGQRIVYHTCGGMMPILEDIAAMKPDAMETFTPPSMGADVNLAEAKKRIGDKVCMIGGFDQFHYFSGCSPAETRAAVRKCFEDAGENGGYILCPSDHFFDADIELISAFADEARKCLY
ncbi:MAG: uroporphyrinogen decarboxylase family protein [Candidatus Zhuqueibacterota bacterium]